jgi:hypothetical protein
MRTSFPHQPEAQHPKSPAIEAPAGRLPHLEELVDRTLARLCPFWRGFEFISSAGPEDSLLFDDAEGVVERKNGAPEGTR